MGPFDADLVVILGTFGVLGFTFLIVHFKVKKKELEMRGSDPELGPVVDALREDLNDTRAQFTGLQEHTQAQLADMQERLDFAERLLTAGREDKSG